MKTNISTVNLLSVTALLCAAALVGCADYASVGVGYTNAYYVPDYTPSYASAYYTPSYTSAYYAPSYATAYYAPDYTPFYAAYYYDGLPYWGPDITYIRNKVVVKDVDKHVNVNRNISYGGHHFMGASYWHTPRPAVRAGGLHPAVRAARLHPAVPAGGFRRVRR
jgi:hypothetical protein